MHSFTLRLAAFTLVLAVFVVLSGCRAQPSDSLGEAYVAPASIPLRGQLNEKNSTVAALKHGERLSILDVRRRFVKVRTEKGVEGWIDSTQLLSPAQMDQIRKEKKQALALPSEGSATVFEALNLHIEPNRQSPALAKIPEGGSLLVLAHKIEPKTSGQPRVAIFTFEKPSPSSHRLRRERQSKNNYRLPPKPAAPKPPENWQELSAERISGADSIADMKADREKAALQKKIEDIKQPVIMEDWSLVRTKDNQVGWVLSRNLIMSIPDEVAQYAEGKRITSYFDLGVVNDSVKGVKHNWLWTTSSATLPYDFDAWRVFIWNRRRHRYETSYREHDVEGYFPVHVDPSESDSLGRTFELITKDDDGRCWRRKYFFDGSRVRLVTREEYRPQMPEPSNKPGGLNTTQLQAKAAQQGWFRREWNAFKQVLPGSR